MEHNLFTDKKFPNCYDNLSGEQMKWNVATNVTNRLSVPSINTIQV